MASLKAIRKRIASVKSTQQITKAMKMVAAAKLRRAQEAAMAARPYAEKLETTVGHLLRRVEPGSHPLLRQPEDGGPTLLLLVSGDRGLCGGYNANLIRKAEEFLDGRGEEVRTLFVGRKGAEALRRHRGASGDVAPVPPPEKASGVARELARRIERAFVAEEIASAYLIFSTFRSTLSQVPTLERLLPLEHETDLGEGEDYLFEPGPEAIVGTLLPRLIEVRVHRALLEAGASEQGARMTAMDSATRNASEMIDRLTLEMNRTRQAAITKELMEIIGGAEALQG